MQRCLSGQHGRNNLIGLVGVAVLLLLAGCGTAPPQPQATESADEATVTTEEPATAPTPTPDVLGVEQTVTVDGLVGAEGYAFRPPRGWQVDTAAGITTMQPPAEAEEDAADSRPERVMVLSVVALEQLNIEGVTTDRVLSLDDLYEGLLTSLEQETLEFLPGEPGEITVDGVAGRLLPFTSVGFSEMEGPLQGYLAVALLDKQGMLEDLPEDAVEADITGVQVFVMLDLQALPADAAPDAAPGRNAAEQELFQAVLESVRFL